MTQLRADTPQDVGLLLRERRKQLRLSQSVLAERAGVARSSVVAVEAGHARAELAVVLRLLRALDLVLDVSERPVTSRPDLAAHLARFDEPSVSQVR